MARGFVQPPIPARTLYLALQDRSVHIDQKCHQHDARFLRSQRRRRVLRLVASLGVHNRRRMHRTLHRGGDALPGGRDRFSRFGARDRRDGRSHLRDLHLDLRWRDVGRRRRHQLRRWRGRRLIRRRRPGLLDDLGFQRLRHDLHDLAREAIDQGVAQYHVKCDDDGQARQPLVRIPLGLYVAHA